MIYPAFRPIGEEIQVGDLVRRISWDPRREDECPGVVLEIVSNNIVKVWWCGRRDLYGWKTDKKILEVISEGR